MKILSGVYARDEGRIFIDGQEIEPRNARHAQTLGISIIYQTFSQAPHLNVAENLFLGREPLTPWGTIDARRTRAMSRDALARVGLDLDPQTPIKKLSVAQRQMLEIAKALTLDAKIVIMDEPTSALTDRETRRLFQIIGALKAEGRAIIYISHRLEEVARDRRSRHRPARRPEGRQRRRRDGRRADADQHDGRARSGAHRLAGDGGARQGGAARRGTEPQGRAHGHRSAPASGRDRCSCGPRRLGPDGAGARDLRRRSDRCGPDPGRRQTGPDPPSGRRRQARHRLRHRRPPAERPAHDHVDRAQRDAALAAPVRIARRAVLERGRRARRRRQPRAPAQGPDSLARSQGALPERRQSAEGGAGQVADGALQHPDHGRADAGHRRGRQRGRPPADGGFHPQGRRRHPPDLVGPAGSAAHERSDPGDARGQHRG